MAGVWASTAERARNILESGDVGSCDTFAADRL